MHFKCKFQTSAEKQVLFSKKEENVDNVCFISSV